MKKLLLVALVSLLCLNAMADKVDVVDSSANRLTMKVLATTNKKQIPVEISMVNAVPITCVKCSLIAPDTADIFVRSQNETHSFLYTPSERWASQHDAIFMWNPRSHQNSLMLMVVSSLSENLKGNDGPIIKVYVDGSGLSDGQYSVRLVGGDMVWTDKKEIVTYKCADQEAVFSIADGKVEVQE